MKKILGEFKKFITRGNVVDMAVGVTVGGAFTAIVNGLTNFVLKPIVNWFLLLLIPGDAGLSNIYTFLGEPVYAEAGSTTAINHKGKMIELSQSIYIDWGSFINAILNFLIIAVVLFAIVKIINTVRENAEKFQAYGASKKQFIIELKAAGVKPRDKAAVAAYLAEKEKVAAEKAEAEAAEAAEKARLDRLENPTTEDLLKDIRELLKERR